LRGGRDTLTRVDYVVLEASFKELYEGETLFREMLAMMEQNEFRFLRPVSWLSDPRTGEVIQVDGLFGRAHGGD